MAAIIAAIRTMTAVWAAWLVARLASVGIAVEVDVAEAFLSSLAVGAVTVLWTWASKQWPIVAKIVSLFTAKTAPTYVTTTDKLAS